MSISTIFNDASVVLGIAAGTFWFKASIVTKSPGDLGRGAMGGFVVGLPGGGMMEIVATMKAQSAWSARGAIAASAAAFTQALSLLF